MKEITSKRTGKIQIITDAQWDWFVAEGKKKLFKVVDMPSKPLKDTPPVINKPPEIKTAKKKTNG